MEWLWRAIELCIEAHQKYSSEPKKSVRLWDEKTPYAIHPIWCALTFLAEANLPDYLLGERKNCTLALLFHDVKEDSTMDLPVWLPSCVIEMVESMTFSGKEGATAIEIREIWSHPAIVRLLKLYDKVSNLLDGSWMTDEKWNNQYVPYVQKLADDVELNFGSLNIVRIARSIAIPRKGEKSK